MALPDTLEQISDGALALVADDLSKVIVAAGISTRGSLTALRAFTDPKDVVAEYGSGPLVEDLAHSLDTGGGTVYGMRILGSVAGSISTITQTGTGPLPTLTGNPIGAFDGRIKIIKGGAVGTATYAISYDGGTTYGPESATAASVILGEGLSMGSVSSSGSGTPPVLTLTGQPLYEIKLRIECTTIGALGVWVFRWSVDNGATWTSGVTSAASVVLTGTGLTLGIAAGTAALDNVWLASSQGMKLAFTAGTYVAGEVYSFTTKQAGYSTSDMSAAFDAARQDPREWNMFHLIGLADGVTDDNKVTASVAMASALAAKLDNAFTVYHRGIRAIMDGPDVADTSAGDTSLLTGFASFVNPRIVVGADFAYIRSPISRRVYRQSAAWVAVSQARRLSLSTDLGEVLTGRLPSAIVGIRRNEEKRPGLNDQRFLTLRTYYGKPLGAFYITKPKTMAAPGDFELLQHGRIIDVASAVARTKGLDLISKKQRANANGTITEIDARAIEREINSTLSLAIVQPGHAIRALVEVNRSDNIVSTKKLRFKVRVRPYAYPEFIESDIGFENILVEAA